MASWSFILSAWSSATCTQFCCSYSLCYFQVLSHSISPALKSVQWLEINKYIAVFLSVKLSIVNQPAYLHNWPTVELMTLSHSSTTIFLKTTQNVAQSRFGLCFLEVAEATCLNLWPGQCCTCLINIANYWSKFWMPNAIPDTPHVISIGPCVWCPTIYAQGSGSWVIVLKKSLLYNWMFWSMDCFFASLQWPVQRCSN